MRERLHFRAWVDGHMHYSDSMGHCAFWDHFNPAHPANRDTIYMQWTGLLDSRGVKIYEGDIVEMVHISKNVYSGPVQYDRGVYTVDTRFYNWHIHLRELVSSYSRFTSYTVTGNCYEHLALLNGGLPTS